MKKLILILLTSCISSWAWAAGGWSAIAYDTTNGKYGFAYGTYNKQQAESNAIAYCNSYNCRVVVTAYNGWAALAISKTDVRTYGVGYAPDRFQALYWSLYYCNQGPSACKVVVSIYAHD